jgi:integrase
MPRKSDGSGTLYQRGNIWWVKIRVDGRPVYESSKSEKKSDAIKLRDKMLAKKSRGELSGGAADKVLIGELLDDFLKSDIKPSTRYIAGKVIEKNIRPYFGKIRAQRLTTDLMDRYRAQRTAAGKSDSTANRELSILRTSFHNARKRTPPKVLVVPYFPIVAETTIRKGFLTDEQHDTLLKELPAELKGLFITGYITGLRKGEITSIQWPQVDFEAGLITLGKGETKNDEARSVPIIDGDMRDLLTAAKKERDEKWPSSPWVFNRAGEPIRDFRWSWDEACKRAGVPDLKFHDLRRTAVRNMRRAGIPQVIRMKISGHKTDSMERRYNIVDGDDLNMARELMQNRRKVVDPTPDTVTKTVTTAGESGTPGDTVLINKSAT